jgi:hypothetical protein
MKKDLSLLLTVTITVIFLVGSLVIYPVLEKRLLAKMNNPVTKTDYYRGE